MKANGVLWAVSVMTFWGGSIDAQEYVNGYTYVAPSYYLSPPVITAGPPYVAAVDAYGPTFAPAYQPVPVYQSVPLYHPVPVYQAPAYLPAPVPVYHGVPVGGVYVRERWKASPRELEYTLKTYGPHGRIQKTEIEWDRRGLEIKRSR